MSSTCKGDHVVFVFLCLAYFTQPNTLQVHLCCCKWQDFLLFCGRIIFHCEYIYVSICLRNIHTQHILFIHSSAVGYLDCFHALALVNNAITSVKGCRPLFKLLISFLSGISPEMRILDHMVVLVLIF